MLWFRDQRWHWAGGLVAALAFCYGASMAWRIQHIGQVLSLAYLPIAMLCLERALARGSILYGAAAGVVAACHRARPRSGGAARRLSSHRLRALASALGRPAGGRRARQPPAAVDGRSRCRRAHRRARDTDRAAGGGIQPALHRLYRRGARLAAPGLAAHIPRAGGVRRLGPHGGLLGSAELCVARLRASSSPRTWASSTSAPFRSSC